MRRWRASLRALCSSPRSFASVTRRATHRSASAQAAQPAVQHDPLPRARQPAPPPPSRAQAPQTDPYKILAPELTHLRTTLLGLLGSSHPGLTQIAEYYFLHPSKQLRPLLVLLFARATNGLGAGWPEKRWAAHCEGARGRAEELDSPLSRADVLNDWNPNMPDHTASFATVFALPPPRPARPSPVFDPPSHEAAPGAPALAEPHTLLPTQMRLAQIVEMIHVASLLHDDVIDTSPLRRGAPSAPAAFGNKLSVLAGDFLLGRASAALSRLGEPEVVELIASVIANLVEGEILQMREVHGAELGLPGGSGAARAGADMWSIYLKKSYLKTASLMAKGARAAVVLGGTKEGEIWKEVAYAYGRNLGIAFQVRGPPPAPDIAQKPNFAPASSSTIFWTTKRARARWGSPGGRICASGSPRARRCTPGRSTKRWAR